MCEYFSAFGLTSKPFVFKSSSEEYHEKKRVRQVAADVVHRDPTPRRRHRVPAVSLTETTICCHWTRGHCESPFVQSL